MKPLYHCAKCGRLSTVLSSYKSVGAQHYCKGCAPQKHLAGCPSGDFGPCDCPKGERAEPPTQQEK